MKQRAYAIILLAFSINVYAAERVSIINLIANPQSYNGKEIMIGGYLSLEFEGTAIYLSKDDWQNLICKNGFWCNVDLVKYKEFDKKFVNVEGVFDSSNFGHMGLWSGSIVNVKRMWLPPERK